MSSLAAARADNFYHPPDFDPKKHKSLNKVNMHAWQPIQCYSNSSPMLGSLGPIFPLLDSRFLTSSSQYNNSHGALGVRANKLESHGILVIRCACVHVRVAVSRGAMWAHAKDNLNPMIKQCLVATLWTGRTPFKMSPCTSPRTLINPVSASRSTIV